MTEHSGTANSDPNGMASGNSHSLLDLLLDWNHCCHLSSEADAIGIPHKSSFSRLTLPTHSIY